MIPKEDPISTAIREHATFGYNRHHLPELPSGYFWQYSNLFNRYYLRAPDNEVIMSIEYHMVNWYSIRGLRRIAYSLIENKCRPIQIHLVEP